MAHITGVVFQIATKAGDSVAAGDPVIVLESMKMEIPVEAPRAGARGVGQGGRGPDGAGGRHRGGPRMSPAGVTLIRDLYAYHRWANRRLFDVAAGLAPGLAGRDMGPHWSVPTVQGMLTHIYGADFIWLARWKGSSPARIPGAADFPGLSDLRPKWDELEAEQQAYVDGLGEADLARPVTYRNTEGAQFTVALGPLLQHVANHATHHRSEVATMVTLLSSSPPDTGINTYRVTVVKG